MARMVGLDLFSGIGGIGEALSPWVKSAAYCEIEPYARALLFSRMKRGEIDAGPVHVDVSRLGKSALAEVGINKVDIVFGGFPCFEAGTLVLARDGYVPIEDVAIGDEVLTHTGEWHRVLKKHVTLNRPLFRVKGMGTLPTFTTREHPYLAAKFKGEPGEWTNAEHVKGKRLFFIAPPVEPDSHSEDFWWVVGRYIADGWLVNRKDRGDGGPSKVIICCGHDEVDELEFRIARVFHSTKAPDRTAMKFHISNKEFARFLLPAGRLAHNKHIPASWMALDRSKAAAFLEGYMSGDGYSQRIPSGTWNHRAATTSKKLALGLASMVLRAKNVACSVYEEKLRKPHVLEGRLLTQRPQWSIRFSDSNRSADAQGHESSWSLCREAGDAGRRATVYNLQVEGDESYIANGAVVHNCTDISLAGERRGIDERSRSGLFYQIARILGEVRPRFVMMENVSAIRSMGIDQVMAELHDQGYDARYGILSAYDCGACHMRSRWWLVGRRRDAPEFGPCHANPGHGAAIGCPTCMSRNPGAVDPAADGLFDMVGAFLDGSWEDGVPRLTDVKEHRADRLRLLGNSVFPLSAREAFLRLTGIGGVYGVK